MERAWKQVTFNAYRRNDAGDSKNVLCMGVVAREEKQRQTVERAVWRGKHLLVYQKNGL